MKRILIVALMLLCAASLAYAANGDESMKANEPIGAAVEATGMFAGKVVSVVTETATGGSEASVKVADDAGKVVTFPVDPTVTIVDAAVNVVTLNQLKEGDKVTVEYAEDQSGVKAKSISVEEE